MKNVTPESRYCISQMEQQYSNINRPPIHTFCHTQAAFSADEVHRHAGFSSTGHLGAASSMEQHIPEVMLLSYQLPLQRRQRSEWLRNWHVSLVIFF